MIILLNTKINQTKVVFEDNNVKKKYTFEYEAENKPVFINF